MVARVGLEPTTYRVWTDRSSQLSYLARINGRDDRIRTCDTLIPNQVLYQAELHPENTNKLMARPVGLEPATFWSVVKRSIQLSYGRKNTLVGMEGFEPSQYCYQGILSPSRLPFRHIPSGGSYQIRTGDHRVAVYCLTTWLRNHIEYPCLYILTITD